MHFRRFFRSLKKNFLRAINRHALQKFRLENSSAGNFVCTGGFLFCGIVKKPDFA